MTDQTAVWIDGDPLMEAIAADVWAQCRTEGTSLVVDGPRNIAAVAAAVARAHAAAVPAPAADQAALYREVADECDKAGAAYTARALNDHAGAAFALMETFLRKANNAEYVATPCDFVACEPGGEPCSTHERLMAHAEGEHELCGPECHTTDAELRRMADETQQPGARQSCACGQDGCEYCDVDVADEEQPAATCTNCRGTGLDPRYSTGEYDCPDCPPANEPAAVQQPKEA